MEELLVPTWLEPLLSAKFFNICPRHQDTPKYECNMFCLDCKTDSFCSLCRSSEHEDHFVIQIRRSSYHNVVKVADMSKLLDISRVQPYIINSAKVIFLNSRPSLKCNSTDKSHPCRICGRTLLDPSRFCSLGCKLESIKKYGGSFIRLPPNEKEELPEGSQQDTYAANTQSSSLAPPPPAARLPPPTRSSSRRRKGIPRRSPLD